MPRDLFGDIVRSVGGPRGRHWYALPLSLLIHTFVLAAAVIVPLMAMGVLPSPARGGVEFVPLATVTPPAVPAAPRVSGATSSACSVQHPDAAPRDAPVGIADEPGLAAAEPREGEVSRGVPEGIPGSIAGGLPEPAPPPPPPAVPVRVYAGVRPPAKVKDVSPVYPALALAAKVEGVVIVEAVIGPDGLVTGARVLRSITMLDQAALDAVRQWVFTPTLLNGVPVAVVMTVTVRFTLK